MPYDRPPTKAEFHLIIFDSTEKQRIIPPRAGRGRVRQEDKVTKGPEDAKHTRAVMTVRDAARYLGLSESTLNKMRCREGGPSYFTVGQRLVRYSPDHLDSWLRSQLRSWTGQYVKRPKGYDDTTEERQPKR
jgi:excisionase family DNA binding protein